ncbi:MAG: hypothetical protein EOO56_08460 [Hymenobacter sp.]|nr:MAG: hypothetical protein EOO56_08460 [Hymenobacter sp.]
MKFAHFFLAASLCSVSAASAQTAPSQSAPRGTGSAAPSTVPSGTAPTASDPKGNVSAGEVFTTGSPDNNRSVKGKKQKASMSSGSGKMKTKM